MANLFETIWSLIAGAVKSVALAGGVLLTLLGLYFAIAALITRRRAHLLEIYNRVFELLDKSEMRDARSYVYSLAKEFSDPQTSQKRDSRDAFRSEHWHELDAWKNDPFYPQWTQHREKVERVARSFDQLGLLVREGGVPINLVARFYGSPALRCWHALAPYLNEERSAKVRNQPGHMWEWEHLVTDVIIPGLESDAGVWKGTSRHDKLQDVIHRVKTELSQMVRDDEYAPPSKTWEVGPLWDCRKW